MLTLPFLFTLAIRAQEVAVTDTSSAARRAQGVTPVQLLNCQPNEFQRGMEPPENKAQAAAKKANLSDQEVLARLIYAESLSTGYWKGRCQAPSAEAIMEGIGWGVMNRVIKKTRAASPYYAAVFAIGQFSTSLRSTKGKPNPFAKAFLCPLTADQYLKGKAIAREVYAQSQKIAAEIIKTYNRTQQIPKTYDRIDNFFYPYSEYFGELRPTWADKTSPRYKRVFDNPKPCVEFYGS